MNIGPSRPRQDGEQNDFTRRLVAGEAISSLETQRVTKDGRVLDIWMTVTNWWIYGKPIGIASTERDITEPSGGGEPQTRGDGGARLQRCDTNPRLRGPITPGTTALN